MKDGTERGCGLPFVTRLGRGQAVAGLESRLSRVQIGEGAGGGAPGVPPRDEKGVALFQPATQTSLSPLQGSSQRRSQGRAVDARQPLSTTVGVEEADHLGLAQARRGRLQGAGGKEGVVDRDQRQGFLRADRQSGQETGQRALVGEGDRIAQRLPAGGALFSFPADQQIALVEVRRQPLELMFQQSLSSGTDQPLLGTAQPAPLTS